MGVQLGSIQEGKAKEIRKKVDMKIENRNRVPELIQEIMTGRFDAAIIEDTVAKGYFKKKKILLDLQLVIIRRKLAQLLLFLKTASLQKTLIKY